jgi:glycosyltransferase involved in cell wall biosynthesis
MSETPVLSVVLPCLNEGAHLEESLGVIARAVEDAGVSYELIVIDDGSSDDTWEVLKRCRESRPQLRAVRLSRRFGKEFALCAGMERARGQGLLVMDGDLQHPPSLIPRMVAAWREEGFEVVQGQKEHRGEEPFLSALGARFFYGWMRRLSGFDLHGASDFQLLDRRAVDAWRTMGERGVFFRGMSAWLGFKRKQIPFRVEERAGGATRWGPLGLARLAVTSITAFSSAPIHLLTLTGAVFFLFALLLGIHTLYNWLSGRAEQGFTTVIVLVLLVGSLLLMGLGLIGLYVSRIYDEVKGRPRYVVADELGRTPPGAVPDSGS